MFYQPASMKKQILAAITKARFNKSFQLQLLVIKPRAAVFLYYIIVFKKSSVYSILYRRFIMLMRRDMSTSLKQELATKILMSLLVMIMPGPFHVNFMYPLSMIGRVSTPALL